MSKHKCPIIIEITNLKNEPRNVQLFHNSPISRFSKITIPIKYTRFDSVNDNGSISMKQDDVSYWDVLNWVNHSNPIITKILAVYDTPNLLTKTTLRLTENIWVSSSDIFGYNSTFPIELKSGLVDNKLVGEVEENGFELNMNTSILIPFSKNGKITLHLYRD